MHLCMRTRTSEGYIHMYDKTISDHSLLLSNSNAKNQRKTINQSGLNHDERDTSPNGRSRRAERWLMLSRIRYI